MDAIEGACEGAEDRAEAAKGGMRTAAALLAGDLPTARLLTVEIAAVGPEGVRSQQAAIERLAALLRRARGLDADPPTATLASPRVDRRRGNGHAGREASRRRQAPRSRGARGGLRVALKFDLNPRRSYTNICSYGGRLCPAFRERSQPGSRGGWNPPEDRWEEILRGLEGIGAAVESERSGRRSSPPTACAASTAAPPRGVLSAAREAVGPPSGDRGGPDPLRGTDRSARAVRPPGLAPRVGAGGPAGRPPRARRAVWSGRWGSSASGPWARFGALTPDQVADRFGPVGLRALRLARGEDEPLRPRDAARGAGRGDRAAGGDAGQPARTRPGAAGRPTPRRPTAAGRTLLGLRLGALLGDGGSWSVVQGLGRPTASARVLRTVLAPRLEDAARARRVAAAARGRPRPRRRPISSSSRWPGRGAAAPAARRRRAGGARRAGRRGPAQGPAGRRRLPRPRAPRRC